MLVLWFNSISACKQNVDGYLFPLHRILYISEAPLNLLLHGSGTIIGIQMASDVPIYNWTFLTVVSCNIKGNVSIVYDLLSDISRYIFEV